MAVQLMPVDPNAGIPDLVRRLADDSRRLAADEVRLAKLELHESVDRGGHGAVLLAVALGASVVSAVMLTLFVVTLVGRVSRGHMWVGAMITGVAELLAATWLAKRGAATLAGIARTSS